MRVMIALAVLFVTACQSFPKSEKPASPQASTSVGGHDCAKVIAACKVRQCEGTVLVQYDISYDGKPENAKVLAACPPGIYDKAALDAIPNWKYDSPMFGKKGLKTAIEFREEGE